MTTVFDRFLPLSALALVSLGACAAEPDPTPVPLQELPLDDAAYDVTRGANRALLSRVDVQPAGPLDGWNILQPEYLEPHLLDGVSLEWDYFMIHDRDEKFTGIVGYVLADPRRWIGSGTPADPRLNLMPSGGNVAVAGRFFDGSQVSNYVNFGVDNTDASATERSFNAENVAAGERASITPLADGSLLLEGQTADISYNLVVSEDWVERRQLITDEHSPFAPVRATDVGLLPGEHWTVNMLWPRTQVTGTVTRRDTGEVLNIEGHGYRENSWGRWTFVTDGWDFAIASDETTGVQWAWQTYHNGETLDFLDMSFYDGGTLRSVQFRGDRGELGWSHKDWSFNREARQCAPRDTTVVADNGEYRVEAELRIGDQQVPLLSDTTPVTSSYAIMEHFPVIRGTITRVDTGAVVTGFQGRAGGEISFLRSPWYTRSDWACRYWGRKYGQKLGD